MPRRRMLDPSFTDDVEVAQLTWVERCFVIGCLRNADDEGRLIGHAGYLRSQIFMYDEDIEYDRMREIKESTLKKMSTWRTDNIWRLVSYENSNQEYLYFPNWFDMEKPSHPTPSKLPPPPEALSNNSRATREADTRATSEAQEELPPETGTPPPQSSVGQSSLGKDSIVKSSAVREDFTRFLSNEKDLTDFLMTTLEKYLPAGPTHAMEPIKLLWKQATGEEIRGETFQQVYMSLSKYPIPVLARSLAKAVKYSPGKTKPYRYIKTIFEEQMKEYEKERPP